MSKSGSGCLSGARAQTGAGRHVLEHVPGYVLKHVPKHVLRHMPDKHVPKHVLKRMAHAVPMT